MEIIKLKLSELTPYEKNAKLHPQHQVEQIKESIQRFGMNDPIGVWGDKNTIVEGHGRYMALQQLGVEEVECIRLDHLTKAELKEYSLIHNKTTMNSDFDISILNEELKSIMELDETIDMSFFDFDLDPIFNETEAQEDNFDVEAELPEEPVSKPGDIYELGIHRLMCGDSTNEEDVAKLMNGEKADLLFTDPPYNVAIENSQGMTIKNDSMADNEFHNFLFKAFKNANASLKNGGAFYVWYASREHINFESTLKENDMPVREQLIWVKNSFTFGRQDYKWQHEPCLYGWKDGAPHYFVEEYNHPTIIEDKLDIDKLKKEEMKALLEEMLSPKVATSVIHEDKPLINDLHPTMKPLKMCGELIKHSARNEELVLDLFGGSGSTLIVCEQIGRRCNMMEYDPKYADVIVKRWEQLTGRKARLINGSGSN